jgi:hypothetical protein
MLRSYLANLTEEGRKLEQTSQRSIVCVRYRVAPAVPSPCSVVGVGASQFNAEVCSYCTIIAAKVEATEGNVVGAELLPRIQKIDAHAKRPLL